MRKYSITGRQCVFDFWEEVPELMVNAVQTGAENVVSAGVTAFIATYARSCENNSLVIIWFARWYHTPKMFCVPCLHKWKQKVILKSIFWKYFCPWGLEQVGILKEFCLLQEVSLVQWHGEYYLLYEIVSLRKSVMSNTSKVRVFFSKPANQTSAASSWLRAIAV